MPIGVSLFLGFVAVFIVAIGIKAVSDSRAEAARAETQKRIDAEKAEADRKFWAEANIRAEKQQRELNEKMKADMDALVRSREEGLSKTKYDYQEMLKNQPPPAWTPNQKYAGGSGPPPGTVYEQDKYGQLHQVR